MLRPLQESFSAADYPDLLVGLAEPDDAAVWRLDDERLLVMTTDFFTPVVDDPYQYGAIAAANALSDLYAMGADPFLALNIAALPPDLPPEIVLDIFAGVADKVKEAGAVIAGGHTVQDPEPKVGLVALGFASPDELMTKGKAKPGDKLILTKPLGMGVTATAIKAAKAAEADIEQAVDWMMKLNRPIASIARQVGTRAATDVTGYSLLGHGLEMAANSQVRLRLDGPAIPVIAGAVAYASRGFVPGGTNDNRAHYSSQIEFAGTIPEPWPTLLFDAQTSGGLLLALPGEKVDEFNQAAEQAGEAAWLIGEVEAGEGVKVTDQGMPGQLGASVSNLAFLTS